MYAVLVVVLPILIVVFVVIVARRITTVVVTAIAVLVVFLVVGRPLFIAYLGTVSLLVVRTTAVVLFVAAFAIFTALLIEGTVFLVGK